MKLLFLSTRVLICSLLGMLILGGTMGVTIILQELENKDRIQQSTMLGLALNGASEMESGHVLDAGIEAENSLHKLVRTFEGSDFLESVGAQVQLLRFTPGDAGNSFAPVSTLVLGSLSAEDLAHADDGLAESLTMLASGMPVAHSLRYIEAGKNMATKAPWLSVAVPLKNADGKLIGSFVVQQPSYRWQHLLSDRKFYTAFMLPAVVALLPGIFIALSFGATMRRRMRGLSDGLVALREGTWTHRVPVRGRDEAASLALQFNETLDHLQKEEDRKQLIIQETLTAKKIVETGMEAKSDFLANMSHEIRTPMNGIIGTTSLLLDTHLDSEQVELVRMLRSSGESLLHLINDILDFSKIDSAKMILEQAPVNLEELFQQAISIITFKSAEKGVEVNHHVSDSLPPNVTGDFQRLKQVLVNLMGNAIKFTEKGEILLIAQPVTRRQADGTQLSFLHISVRDTGIGIPKEKIPQLFQAFTQADSSTTRKYGGTGLGLAISRKLCRLMGGDVDVVSEIGVGSNFFVEVPLRAAPDNQEHVEEDRQLADMLKGKHIRLISAHETTVNLLLHYCRSFGMFAEVRLAERRCTAASCLEGSPPLLVMDTCNRVRNIMEQITVGAKEANIAIVGLVPLGHELERETLQSVAGPRSSFISKPVNRRDLMKALVQAMNATDKVKTPHLSQAAKKAAARRNFATNHPARILLVEDQALNQKLAIMMLAKLGYDDVALAENGREAVDRVSREHFDLVFMDLQMPVLGGEDAVREIRANFLLTHQPIIIAMTGHALTGVKEACMRAGMNEFLSKPVSLDDLRGAISGALGGAPAGERASVPQLAA